MLFLSVRASDQTSIVCRIFFASFFFFFSWVLPVKCFPPQSGTEGFGFKQCLFRGSLQGLQNYNHGVASIISHWMFKNEPPGEQTMHSKNQRAVSWVAHLHEPFCYGEHCGIRLLANVPGNCLTIPQEKKKNNRLFMAGNQRSHASPGSGEDWCTTAVWLCFTC